MIETIGLLVGVSLLIVALVALLRIAFKTDLIWGLMGLLLVPLLFFMFLHPAKTRYAMAVFFIGLATAGMSLWGGADRTLDLKGWAQEYGIAELPGINLLRAPLVTEPVAEITTEEPTEPEVKEVEKKKKAVSKTKSSQKFRQIAWAEVEQYVGSLFQGKTYDGRIIQGKIISVTNEVVTLSRPVSQGSASFDYRLGLFQTIMVASP